MARIVAVEPAGVPASIADLVQSGGIEYRAPILGELEPVALTLGEKTASDYVAEQRR